MDYSRVLRLCLALITISSAMQTASAQVTDIKVQIINSPPKTLDSYAPAVVKSGGTDVAWCMATVEDLNSFKDIQKEAAYIESPARQESDYISVEQTSVLKGDILVGFVLPESADAGAYTCVIEATDNSDAKASAKPGFKAYPKTCADKAQDAGETGIDCGGPCMPCTCADGVMDGAETGVDCGGPCQYCRDKGQLAITVPPAVTAGEVIPVQVKSGNKGMTSLIRAVKPSGKTIVFKADESGVLNLNSDETGVWRIQADLYGFGPAEASVEVKASMTPYILVSVAVLIIAVLALIVLRGRKKRAY